MMITNDKTNKNHFSISDSSFGFTSNALNFVNIRCRWNCCKDSDSTSNTVHSVDVLLVEVL